MSELSEPERAYLAGLIDGEGAIMLLRRSKSVGHTLRVYVANTDRRLLDWLAERFGGNVRVVWRSQASERPNERTCYGWQRDARKVRPVLEAALPYLISKRRHAQVALAFADTQQNVGRRGHAPEVIQRRDVLLAEMARLNARGRERTYV